MSLRGPWPFRTRQTGATPAIPAQLAALIERARLDWLAAQSEFNTVTERDLVDHAIYAIQAAERRYVYLLRLAAQMRRQATQAARGTPAEGDEVLVAQDAGELPASVTDTTGRLTSTRPA